jgi:hypothetical protein
MVAYYGRHMDAPDAPDIPQVHAGAASGGERGSAHHHRYDAVESMKENMGEQTWEGEERE